MVCESRGEGRTSGGGNEDWIDEVGKLLSNLVAKRSFNVQFNAFSFTLSHLQKVRLYRYQSFIGTDNSSIGVELFGGK